MNTKLENKIEAYAVVAQATVGQEFGKRNARLFEVATSLGLRHLFDERGFHLHQKKGIWAGREIFAIPL